MMQETKMQRTDTRMFNANTFKLGLFGMNCNGGLTMTKAPERWDQSWANNLRAARLAEDAGLEFLLPIGRWHGYRGETDTEGTTWETLTWATGLLGGTREISCFGTLHVSFANPVFAAKQMVTADHVGEGRFGVNIVSGWNEGEFAMFGIDLLEHDERYAYSEEWATIVKRIWAETEPFDFEGKYFKLRGVLGKPKPVGGSRPLLMSAGSSAAGRAFAVRHADCLFMNIFDLDALPKDVAALRASAPDTKPGVYASGHIISRATRKDTREYYDYIVNEQGDWEAAEHIVAIRISGGGRSIPPELVRKMTERHVSGIGTMPVVGDYDEVAAQFKRMSDAGLDGMAVGLVNYIDEFPILRDEILPRMERLGLRNPHKI
jgi:alkanesulfonate monooxygenase SsuD/methylene tetrahydromethanopterin reductase-like flavin-dependent oxidoreductase (luciferase family)